MTSTSVEERKIHFTEFDDDGNEKKEHQLEFRHSMILPAFKGVEAIAGIGGLCNPRDFIVIDDYQRDPNWASKGKWVHVAKIAYEKYFLHKVRTAKTEPYHEKTIMKLIGVERLKESG